MGKQRINHEQFKKEAAEIGWPVNLYKDWTLYNHSIFQMCKKDKSLKYKWNGAEHTIKGLTVQINQYNNEWLEAQVHDGNENTFATFKLKKFDDKQAGGLELMIIMVVENWKK